MSKDTVVLATNGVHGEELRAASLALRRCEDLIRQFQRENMAVVNGRPIYLSSKLTARRALDEELTALVRQRYKAWARHQTAMQQWAETKIRGAA